MKVIAPGEEDVPGVVYMDWETFLQLFGRIETTRYVAFASATIIYYDHLLTFGQEGESSFLAL
jgi:hypothetical protein